MPVLADTSVPSGQATVRCTLDVPPETINEIINRLKEPRVQDEGSLPIPPLAGAFPEGAFPEDDDGVPREFAPITLAQFEADATAWRNMDKATRGPPPLNLEQRALGRDRIRQLEFIHQGRGRGEDPGITLQAMANAGLRQVNLTQGGAGVGKSAYLQGLKRVMLRKRLGRLGITAWTGVVPQRSRGGWSPAYGALEGLWALTLYLHDDEPNVVSTAVAGAILATATCDAVDAFRTGTTRARTRTWRTAWTVVALVAFVVDNAFPYVHNHARAVYGLWGLPPTVLATTAVVEGALHLRTPRKKKQSAR